MSKPGPGRPCDPKIAEQRCEAIIKSAIKHFSQLGFSNADIEAIAADAGCAKGTVYRYFENKRDLFLKVVDYVIQNLIKATASSDYTHPIERLENAIYSFLTYFDDHPEYVELLIQERSEFKDLAKRACFEYQDSYWDRWLQDYSELKESGNIRLVTPERALDIINTTLYGTIFTNYFAGRRKTVEKQVQDVLDILFHGLLIKNDETAKSINSI